MPRHAVANLVNQESTIQVNHCRNPACGNYGAAPRTMPGKTGPGAGRDPNYKLHSTSGGLSPALLCKSCGESPPIKSNAGIAEEIERLVDLDGLWTAEEKTGCKNADCDNFGRAVACHPGEYIKVGFSPSGGRCYECRRCRRRVIASTALRAHKATQERAADVLSRMANKSPIRGILRGAGLNSPDAYYRTLAFIHARCRAFSARIDRALTDGRLQLPESMTIESDVQSYIINWTSRMDRRNGEIMAACSVDSDSRFILGMHPNFDTGADAFAINTEAARSGDMSAKEPYRKYARYWLAGDDLRAGRSKNFQTRDIRGGLAAEIEALYAGAASRDDVEDIELEHMNTKYRTPYLKNGLLVHMPYTTYAHWRLLKRLLTGSGVRRTQMHFDISSTTRAAFLCAFMEEVKEGRAHAFYVKYDKNFTVDERRAAVANSRSVRSAERKKLPPEERRHVDLILMKRNLEHGHRYGQWDDEWFEHPHPSMNEPHKAMCWLTPDASLDEDKVAEMFLAARLARVDNAFQLSRRLFQAFERPLGMVSGPSSLWYGYQPYNPAMIEKYLGIFRAVNNFIQVGTDGKTPAMRIGFADRPLRYAELIRPEEKTSRRRRTRKVDRRAA